MFMMRFHSCNYYCCYYMYLLYSYFSGATASQQVSEKGSYNKYAVSKKNYGSSVQYCLYCLLVKTGETGYIYIFFRVQL